MATPPPEDRSARQRRIGIAALFLSVIVVTMVATLVLNRGDRDPDEAIPPDEDREEVVPIGAGVTRTVASLSQWDAAVAAAVPGDVIRITANINGRLAYRGTNDGGSGTGAHGTASAPIVITADPGVWVDSGNINSGFGAVEVLYANHVHVVGVQARNSQFGIRCMQCHGEPGAPIRFANNTITNIGHAGIHFAGHWSTHAKSSHGLIENNTISHTGKSAPHFGEGVYIGYGAQEWIDVTSDVVVRYNDISNTGAEGVDVKPGTRNIHVIGNRIHDLAPHDGGAISAHYVNLAANPHANQLDYVLIQGNYIWNQNLGGTSGANDWAIWVGHGGVDVKDNVIWGLRSDPSRARGIRVRATQPFGPHPIRIENNTFWTARGWIAEGSPSGASNVIASGNRGYDASSSEITVTAGDFVGPVPGIGQASTADNGGGPGSAFALAADVVAASTTPTTVFAIDGSAEAAAPPPAPSGDPAPSGEAPVTTAPPTTTPSTAPPTTATPGAGSTDSGAGGTVDAGIADGGRSDSGGAADPTGNGDDTSPEPDDVASDPGQELAVAAATSDAGDGADPVAVLDKILREAERRPDGGEVAVGPVGPRSGDDGGAPVPPLVIAAIAIVGFALVGVGAKLLGLFPRRS